MSETGLITLEMSELVPIIKEAIAEGGEVKVRVKGYSMEPFLVDGRDSVFFSALPQRPFKVGDILLFKRTNGKYVMHRVYDVNSNGITFVGDSQRTLEPGIQPDQVIARVRKAVRKGKTINTEGIWRVIFTVWMKLRIKHYKTAKRLLRLYCFMTGK